MMTMRRGGRRRGKGRRYTKHEGYLSEIGHFCFGEKLNILLDSCDAVQQAN